MIASPVQQTSGGSRLPRDLLHSYSGTSCVSYLVVDVYADTTAINLIVWIADDRPIDPIFIRVC